MLTFDPVAHRYTFDGKPVPSVTTVLKPLYDFGAIDQAVLAAKAALGTAVHVATELDDADDLDEGSVHELVRPYLEAWRLFRRETGATVVTSEQRVYHRVHRYAGTLDRVLSINGVMHLTDIKTSVEIHAGVGPQTAGYLAALGDKNITQRAVVQLKPDGTFRFNPLNDPNDMAVFMSLLTVHRFKERHAI